MAGNRSLLSRLHGEYKANTQSLTRAKRKKISSIDKLKNLQELAGKEDIFSLYIDYSDSESGDLYHYDDVDICYIITADELKKLYPGYIPRGNSYLIGTEFVVNVKEVDEEKGIVYLTAVRNDTVSPEEYKKKAAKIPKYGTDGEALRKILLSALDDNVRKPIVRGTVTKVEKDCIYLDLFDKGVIAVVPVKNYMEQYRRDLRDEVSVGDCLKGIVFAYRARQGEEQKNFLVSTAMFLPDPWKNEKMKQLKKNDVIVIKCVEKPTREKAQYFWGIATILPGIDILSDYTNKVPASIVQQGHYYKCKVTRIDRKGHQISVAPFAECTSYNVENDDTML